MITSLTSFDGQESQIFIQLQLTENEQINTTLFHFQPEIQLGLTPKLECSCFNKNILLFPGENRSPLLLLFGYNYLKFRAGKGEKELSRT